MRRPTPKTTGWMEFPKSPGDDTDVYTYPDEYRIDFRRISGVLLQRHTYKWNGGETDAERWIRSTE